MLASPDPYSEHNPIDQDRLDQLRRVVGIGPVLIVTHDSPDPDALASGKALSILLRQAWDIPSKLVYSGIVARAENQAMLKLLTPEWQFADTFPGMLGYSALAMLDSQPGAGNNFLPDDIIPQVVIDHHRPLRESLARVPFVDVRPELGATTSMLSNYLEALGIVPDSTLATAMFYGLQTDTMGLARGVSKTDELVYIDLLSKLERNLLVQVEQAGLSRQYFSAISNGLQAARVYDRSVIAYLGPIHRPDLTAELADILIRLETAEAVLCIGRHGENLYLSMRTVPMDKDAGWLVQNIVDSLGSAGGHGSSAGGKLPLAGQDEIQLVSEIERRFLSVLRETQAGEPLIKD